NRGEILGRDKPSREPERVFAPHRLQDRLRRRPKEEDDGHRQLRQQQKHRKQPTGKDDAALHLGLIRPNHKSVVPAKAGIHLSAASATATWIPAFAGMTSLGLRPALLQCRSPTCNRY